MSVPSGRRATISVNVPPRSIQNCQPAISARRTSVVAGAVAVRHGRARLAAIAAAGDGDEAERNQCAAEGVKQQTNRERHVGLHWRGDHGRWQGFPLGSRAAAMQIVDRLSPNHDARTGTVDMLILHYAGMVDQPAALARLTDPAAKVSAHYLIGEAGAMIRLVPEDRCAWHAGVSHWRSRADINGASIGIELVNPGHEFGYRDFPAAQMAALAELAKDIVARHKIPTRHVLGHSDVAIGRKQDPGERFDWRWLAQHGIGLWPDFAATPSTGNVAALQR